MANNIPARRKPNRGILLIGWLLMVIAVSLFFAVGWLVISPFRSGMPFGEFPLDTQKAKSSGPSLPLSEILAVAQEEARRVDKDAVFSHAVIATVGYVAGVEYSGPTTESLEVSFDFVRPTGKRISIYVEDADPRSTVRKYIDDVSRPEEYEKAVYQDKKAREQERIDLLLAYKLTPRDAVARTWQDSQDYARKNGLAVNHVLPLISTVKSKSGTPTYSLDYWYHESRSTISLSGIFDIGDPVVSYVVDGLTGEIISTEYSVIPPAPTGTP